MPGLFLPVGQSVVVAATEHVTYHGQRRHAVDHLVLHRADAERLCSLLDYFTLVFRCVCSLNSIYGVAAEHLAGAHPCMDRGFGTFSPYVLWAHNKYSNASSEYDYIITRNSERLLVTFVFVCFCFVFIIIFEPPIVDLGS